MPHYTVIGSGAAGAAMAYRLTCSPDNTVVVLEAGEDARSAAVTDPARWTTTLGTDIDFGYSTVAQAGIGGRAIAYPRGKVLGGTTCLNAMIYMQPADADLAGWGANWMPEDLAPVFRGMEKHLAGGWGRGTEGPAANGPARTPHPLCAAFVDACVEQGYPLLEDVNAPRATGAGWYDLSIDSEGTRADAAQSYLRPYLDRPNLEVRTGWAVTRLLIGDGGRVTSLVGINDGRQVTMDIEGEVVLSAGAIDSPALLLRSGVGPQSELVSAGIDPIVDLPAVGRNLQDHPALPIVWSSREALAPPTAQFFESVLGLQSEERLGGRSALASFGHLAYLPPTMAAPAHGATALIGLLDPRSRGSVRLDSDDPGGHPLIDPALLADPSDVTALVEMVGVIREVAASRALAAFGLDELIPGPVFGNDLHEFVRQSVGTYFHPVGSCRMGDGVDSVVDFDLRVHGLRNLRVVDASVMPRIPTAATSVTAQAIGWHAAEIIDPALREWR